MQKVVYPNKEQWLQLLKRPTVVFDDVEETVKQVFKEINESGDSAVKKYTSYFDGVPISELEVSVLELSEAESKIEDDLKSAIVSAKKNIEKFHKAQVTEKVMVETTNGVQCWQEKKPIERVGLYIPGGSAPLFSTVLMLAVPAVVAGCKEIVLCSPPSASGSIHPAILYAAKLCGITRVFKVGGIQAIGAMTFGTASIPKVYKIFGPGNQFVTLAKQFATQYNTAIDMPAGPSELLVVADDSANPEFVAADLLSQAEHGKDSQVLLVTTSKDLAEKVSTAIERQLIDLPRRLIAEVAIKNSKIIVLDSDKAAVELINEYGPEHLIVCAENEDLFLSEVMNAGSVFVGNFTPESAGDYASGTNHTLPTNGYTKQYSGVNLDSFMKAITYQKISKEGIVAIGRTIEVMAEAEGLQAHKNAVSLRLKSIANENI